jgi:hypothetical protein
MGDQPDRPRDPEGLGALDDMFSQSTAEEVELREWYAARGMWPPPAQDSGQPTAEHPVHRPGGRHAGQGRPTSPPPPGSADQTRPYTPMNARPEAGPPPAHYAGQPPAPGDGYGYGAPPPPPPRKDGPSGAVLGTAAVVGVLVVLAAAMLLWLSGGDSSTPEATATTTSAQDQGASGEQDTQGDGSADGSSEAAPPDGATACEGGASGGLSAAVGNDVTSCGFALNVRDAYAASGTSDGSSVKLKVNSPVTKKNYTMRCEGSNPVTCRGGSNALVYLY